MRAARADRRVRVAALRLQGGHCLQPAPTGAECESDETPMKPIQVEEVVSAMVVLEVLRAWRTFKRTHDVADAKVCCCKHTLKLFETLDEMEKEILQPPL